MAPKSPIVVTGASGLLAKHIIAEFLKSGLGVRGTLRDPGKGDYVKTSVARAGGDPKDLTFVEADLTSDAGWDEAAAGAEVVVHTASPFPMQQPDNPDDLIRPARDGTLRVLTAAMNAGVRRVVITSSTVAILYGSGLPSDHIYSEDDFSDETRSDLTPYIKSKTIAEKAAWAFVKSATNAPELAAVNPGFIQGPALDGDLSTSHELYRLLARGLYPAAPRIKFPVADVRDAAAAHIEAALRPEAAGQRFLVGEGQISLYQLGQVLARELPDLKSKVPKFEMPDAAVRTLALFDKRMRTILPELGVSKDYTNERAKRVLGLSLRSADEAATASVRSLRELKLI